MKNNVSRMGDGEPLIRVGTIDYVSFVKLSYRGLVELLSRSNADYRTNYTFPGSFFSDLRDYCVIETSEVVSVILLAIFLTLLRIYLTNRWFLPKAIEYQITLDNRKKVPESCWKFFYYSVAWCWSAYVVQCSGRYQYFSDPLSVWDDWHVAMPVPIDIKLAYWLQSSFYLHSIYGTIFLDVWRKDSLVMLAHHFLTIVLISFSYASRFHAIGALVLLLHDISDVALEFTKINVYLKHRKESFLMSHDRISTLGFLSFAISWYVFRLYWFPLKVLYAGMYGAVNAGPPDIPFVLPFNIMLWILLAMNCYWFSFILILLVKVATGQSEEIEDTREIEKPEKSDKVS